MYPITLDITRLKIVLAGDGSAAVRRLAGLDAAGAGDVVVFAERLDAALVEAAGSRLVRRLPTGQDFVGVSLLLVAGLEEAAAAPLVAMARALGVLVNVEDRKPWCDFHVPSIVRRGDLQIAISTSGRSPGLARRLRRFLESLFVPGWASHLDELAARREQWRAEGADPAAVSRLTDDLIDRRGWLR